MELAARSETRAIKGTQHGEQWNQITAIRRNNDAVGT